MRIIPWLMLICILAAPMSGAASVDTLISASAQFRSVYSESLPKGDTKYLRSKDRVPLIYAAELEGKEALLNAIRVEYSVALQRGVTDRAIMDQRFAALIIKEFATAAELALQAFEISGRTVTPELKKTHEALLGEIRAAQDQAEKQKLLEPNLPEPAVSGRVSPSN